MGTMPQVGDHAAGIENMPKAWRLCRRHGDHAKGMEIMPKAWRFGMEIMPKTWRPCDTSKNIVTLPKPQ